MALRRPIGIRHLSIARRCTKYHVTSFLRSAEYLLLFFLFNIYLSFIVFILAIILLILSYLVILSCYMVNMSMDVSMLRHYVHITSILMRVFQLV